MSKQVVSNITTSNRLAQFVHHERLIVATNRGPVEFYTNKDNVIKHRRGAGGLVTALSSVGNNTDVTWVAMAMTEGDRLAIQTLQDRQGLLPSPLPDQHMSLHYVTVPKTVYGKHYNIISNQILWFLQHYLYEPKHTDYSTNLLLDNWREGYCRANQAIADAICAEVDREVTPAVVMLHDYHLYLAPALIRQCCPSVVMHHFIHIPWPEVRYWQTSLPFAVLQAIFLGLLGNDIIGFQTRADARNFLEGARVVLDGAYIDFNESAVYWQNHRTLVRDYPISISVTDERQLVQSTLGKRASDTIRPLLCPQNVVRVDRLEPTKNIIMGFQAFGQVLETHPELREKVKFLAFLVPSRETLLRYRQYKDEVLQTIDEINAKYGTSEWMPIQAFLENNRAQALAAMQYYDVLLVNPLIDGMNLVAKEGPIVNRRNGVLVLSRTAGAFQQLGKAAIPTSPRDLSETANALYKALTLAEDERRFKAWQACHIVERNDLHAWMTQQFQDINQVAEELLEERAANSLNVHRLMVTGATGVR
jgi:trehalose 6-phosphate synthase